VTTAKLIDGKALGLTIRQEIATEVAQMTGKGMPAPGLAVVLVGDNPASASYVRAKTKACHDAGFHSVQIDLPVDTPEADLIAKVEELNNDDSIHGILVQLPIPDHINEQKIISAIDPDKDVDGFHPMNAGRLAIGLPGFVPCTPFGVREMLIREGIETSGKFAVVLGRSNIVGKPMAQLLSVKGKGGDATVCICHSRTKDLAEVCARADILVAAIGRAEFVTANMVKPGATVIDVGINRVDDPSAKRGYRLVGDVAFDEVKEIAGAITPVPGGVGPMTIAMLLKNTLTSAKRKAGLE
jgi:methylenetetrahydrofolate dehydrogenase (NADP+) / methenyltetrahydrofolate cyclohydrolase